MKDEFMHLGNPYWRAWFPKSKIMLEDINITDYNDRYFEFLKKDHPILMEWTGFTIIKGKNNKDKIYAGDIINDIEGNPCLIYRLLDVFGYRNINTWFGDLQHSFIDKFGEVFGENSYVIGNICENPELMNGVEYLDIVPPPVGLCGALINIGIKEDK